MSASGHDAIAGFHRALVEEILRTRPHYLREPFTVAEIYQNLVPYRTHRDRIGVEMNGDYEDALLRLLAGEGDYLVLESEHARREIREELESPNPNTGLYREYAAVDVRLNPLRMPSELPEPVWDRPEVAPSEAGPEARDPMSEEEPSAPELALVRDDDRGVQGRGAPDPLPAVCLWCRESLPRRDPLNYCPFCGADLHKLPCPNCGEELEVGWRFCVACGSGVGDGD